MGIIRALDVGDPLEGVNTEWSYGQIIGICKFMSSTELIANKPDGHSTLKIRFEMIPKPSGPPWGSRRCYVTPAAQIIKGGGQRS